MFNFFEKFAYIMVGILVIGFGYRYIAKHYPEVDLPYKDQVLSLENIVVHKLNQIITKQ